MPHLTRLCQCVARKTLRSTDRRRFNVTAQQVGGIEICFRPAYSSSFLKFSESEFTQYLMPVGLGPSSNR